jgi:hypothetical protein
MHHKLPKAAGYLLETQQLVLGEPEADFARAAEGQPAWPTA